MYAYVDVMNLALTWVWLGGIVLQIFLVAAVVARRVERRFPWFATYVLANLAISGVLYVVGSLYSTGTAYFYYYWVTQGIIFLLSLAALFEVFTHLLASYPGLKRLAHLVFRCAILVLTIFGSAVIIAHSRGGTPNAPFVVLETGVRIGQVGLVFLLFGFAGVFGLHWRHSSFGIAMGFGFYAGVQLIALAVHSYKSSIAAGHIFSLATLLAFDISLLIWLRSVLAPQSAISNDQVIVRAELEQWNKALTELIYQ
jgi:hypothetical protein